MTQQEWDAFNSTSFPITPITPEGEKFLQELKKTPYEKCFHSVVGVIRIVAEIVGYITVICGGVMALVSLFA